MSSRRRFPTHPDAMQRGGHSIPARSVLIHMSSLVGTVSSDGMLSVDKSDLIYRETGGGRRLYFGYVKYRGESDQTKGDNVIYRTNDGWTVRTHGTQYVIEDDSQLLLDKYAANGRLVSRTESAYYDLTKPGFPKTGTKEKYFIPLEERDDYVKADEVVYDGATWMIRPRGSQIPGVANYVVLDDVNILRIPLNPSPGITYLFNKDGSYIELRDFHNVASMDLGDYDVLMGKNSFSYNQKGLELALRLFLKKAKTQKEGAMRTIPAGLTMESALSAFHVAENAVQTLVDEWYSEHRPTYGSQLSDAVEALRDAVRYLDLLSAKPIRIDQSELPLTVRMPLGNKKNFAEYGRLARRLAAPTDLDSMTMQEFNVACSSLRQQSIKVPRLDPIVFHEQLVLFLQRYEEVFAADKAVIMGSAAAYLLQTSGRANIEIAETPVPNDVDVWFYNNDNGTISGHDAPWLRLNMFEELAKDGWDIEDWQRPFSTKISRNIRTITTLAHSDYGFKLQFIGIVVDPHVMSNEFDLSVAKVIYNPAIIKIRNRDVFVGFRQTEPDVIRDVNNKRAVFLERSWDIENIPGAGAGITLTKRSISRLVKYTAKGYKIEASPNSKFTTADLAHMMNKMKSEITRPEDKTEYEGFYYYEFPRAIAGFFSELIDTLTSTIVRVPTIVSNNRETRVTLKYRKEIYYASYSYNIGKLGAIISEYGHLLGISKVVPNAELGLRKEWTNPVLRNDIA